MADEITKKKLKNREITRENHVIERDEKGHFIKGKSANPDGKPEGTKSYITLLEEALKDVESVKGKQLFKRFIERAFITDKVLIAAMKKFVPDREHTEIESAEPIQLIIEHVNKKD